jgi:hypothetical protein
VTHEAAITRTVTAYAAQGTIRLPGALSEVLARWSVTGSMKNAREATGDSMATSSGLGRM